jgi:hypothetical protein
VPQELSRLDVFAQRSVDLSEHLRKYLDRTGHVRTDPHGLLADNPYSCQCAGPPSLLGRLQQDSLAGSIYLNNPNIETFHEVKQHRSMEGKGLHPLLDHHRSRCSSSGARSLFEMRLFLHRATIIVSGIIFCELCGSGTYPPCLMEIEVFHSRLLGGYPLSQWQYWFPGFFEQT